MITSVHSPATRRRRAARLRRIAQQLLGEHRFGTLGHTRGRHALFLATLLEMRCEARLVGALRRRSRRDLREHRWYDRGHEHGLSLAADGVVVIEVAGAHVGSEGA